MLRDTEVPYSELHPRPLKFWMRVSGADNREARLIIKVILILVIVVIVVVIVMVVMIIVKVIVMARGAARICLPRGAAADLEVDETSAGRACVLSR